MIDTLTTPERIALRAAVTARLTSAEDADLIGFAADLGLDVRGILADAGEPPAKHRHMADPGKPYEMTVTVRPMAKGSVDISDAVTRPLEPVGLGWAPADLNPDRAPDLGDHANAEVFKQVDTLTFTAGQWEAIKSLNTDRAQIRELGREERNREAQGDRG